MRSQALRLLAVAASCAAVMLLLLSPWGSEPEVNKGNLTFSPEAEELAVRVAAYRYMFESVPRWSASNPSVYCIRYEYGLERIDPPSKLLGLLNEGRTRVVPDNTCSISAEGVFVDRSLEYTVLLSTEMVGWTTPTKAQVYCNYFANGENGAAFVLTLRKTSTGWRVVGERLETIS